MGWQVSGTPEGLRGRRSVGEEEDSTTGHRGQQGRMDHKKEFGFYSSMAGSHTRCFCACIQKRTVHAETHTNCKYPMLGIFTK